MTPATAEQIALFKAWIAAGYPTASCGDAAKDPYAAATKCSGEQLGLHQQEGEDMNAGRACNACHEQVNIEQGGDAPLFTLAGTIFPTAHEPDDCRAPSAEGAQVEITDAKGKVVVVEANQAGNFFYKEPDLTFPYTAKVIFRRPRASDGAPAAERRVQPVPLCGRRRGRAGPDPAALIVDLRVWPKFGQTLPSRTGRQLASPPHGSSFRGAPPHPHRVWPINGQTLRAPALAGSHTSGSGGRPTRCPPSP